MEILRTAVTGPSVWEGSDIANSTDWVHLLEPLHVAEIDKISTRFESIAELEGLRPEEFPHLESLMGRIHEGLTQGKGFVLLRGFPIERYDLPTTERLYLALGRFLGKPVSQNSYGDILGHVRDEGKRVTAKGANTRGARGYLSNEALLFHTDLGDVVGLLCINKAAEGGMSSISSSMRVYNEILDKHPEYLPVYYNGFAFRSVEADGVPTEWRLPIYSYHEGKLSCAMRRMAIQTARLNGLPYTDLENAALEYLDWTAARADLRYDMSLEPGDIQLLNNYVTFHARTDFVDATETAKKRHLLRLWLQLPDGRAFLRRYHTIYDGIPHTIDRATA
jgi:hypothetical protein